MKPAYSIFSRNAFSQRHLRSIGVKPQNLKKLKTLSPKEYIVGKTNLIDYESFFDNYVVKGINRNYYIIAINIHKLWDNLAKFFSFTDIPLFEIKNFPIKSIIMLRNYWKNMLNQAVAIDHLMKK